ncbi:FecR family protein [Steroidobacter flavus]|uniref:FecR family protein n=1 Tax=Steroidobacter flavus TaxID=1842136 RepID=A0ABV8T3M7_9GAMM
MSDASVDSVLSESARRWVLRLASGEMSADDMRTLKQWLSNPEHRRAFESARSAWRQVESLRERVGSSLPAAAKAGDRRRNATLVGGLAAACLALFIWLGNPIIWWKADHATEVGEIAKVTLPDGSTAILDTNSALAVHHVAGERAIELLKGQAWFDVKPDRDNPFRVHAGTDIAEAVGTAFSVSRTDDTFAVRVTKGLVAVSTHDKPEPIHVGAGRCACSSEIVAFDEHIDLEWREQRIVIENMPFEDALAELDRYRPGRIVLLGKRTARAHVSAVLSLEGLDHGLNNLARMQGLRMTYLTPYLVLLTEK